MSKIDVVRAAMVAAMKSKEKERKDALSMLLSALKNAEIDKREPLTEDEENAVVKKEIKQLKETWESYEEILKKQDCLSLKDLKINGNQLKALGIREGKTIGAILKTLLSMVLEHPELNEYSYLKELALKIYRQLRP